jgi:hypothetical protein
MNVSESSTRKAQPGKIHSGRLSLRLVFLPSSVILQ